MNRALASVAYAYSDPEYMSPASELVEISTATHPLVIDLVYGHSNNLAGRQIYTQAHCALRPEAAACLWRAAVAAKRAGYTIKVFDAYRPPAAQAIFWSICPDPRYIADPGQGSNHTRGVAVDVTLLDENHAALDMGTAFDTMQDQSHHDRDDLPTQVQRNRSLLLGIMLQAGFCSLATEWWHYELPNAQAYSLLDDPAVQAVRE
jgi:D-alanyl-D-alanine dipeptidase